MMTNTNWFIRVDPSTGIFATDAEKKRDASEVQDAIRSLLLDLVDPGDVVVIKDKE